MVREIKEIDSTPKEVKETEKELVEDLKDIAEGKEDTKQKKTIEVFPDAVKDEEGKEVKQFSEDEEGSFSFTDSFLTTNKEVRTRTPKNLEEFVEEAAEEQDVEQAEGSVDNYNTLMPEEEDEMTFSAGADTDIYGAIGSDDSNIYGSIGGDDSTSSGSNIYDAKASAS